MARRGEARRGWDGEELGGFKVVWWVVGGMDVGMDVNTCTYVCVSTTHS